MRRYLGVALLSGLLTLPSLLLADPPAPQPCPEVDLKASAALAEKILAKEYGADTNGIKGAKVKLVLRLTESGRETEFAIAAEDIIFSDDGKVTFKNIRQVMHSFSLVEKPGQKVCDMMCTNEKLTMLTIQLSKPVRRIADLNQAQYKSYTLSMIRMNAQGKIEIIEKSNLD